MIDEKQTKVNTHTGLKIIVVVIFSLFVGVALSDVDTINQPQTNTQTPTPTPEKFDVNDMGDKIDLHVQAQGFVIQSLKAPSTAKFPALPYEVRDLGDGRYFIDSYVDSQNSFGAMIRSNWSVTMRLTGEKWLLERMVVDGKVVYDPVQAQKNLEQKKKNDAEIEKLTNDINQQLEYMKSFQDLDKDKK